MIQTFRNSIILLTDRRFGTFWWSSLFSSIGTWTQQVAEPWLLLSLSASSFVIGMDTFAMNAPVWILILAGGALADRADRRLVITYFQSIQMLCPATIVVLLLCGSVHAWMIIGLSVVVGITDALSMPSYQSIVPSIVLHKQISQGLALNSTQFNLSRILGPVLAGLLMSGVGSLACFAVSALSYIPFIGVALWILPRSVHKAAPHNQPGTSHPWQHLMAIVRQRAQRGALLTVLNGSTLCAPLIIFIPLLIKHLPHAAVSHYALLIALFGTGGLLGGLALLGVAPQVDRLRLSGIAALVQAMSIVGIAMCPWFWSMQGLMIVAGASMTISATAANTLLQSNARTDELGQTVSLYMLAMRGGISLGALLTGAMIGFLGVQNALLLNGILSVLIQTAVMYSCFRSDVSESHRANLSKGLQVVKSLNRIQKYLRR